MQAGKSGSPEDIQRADEARALRTRFVRELEALAVAIEDSAAGLCQTACQTACLTNEAT